MSKCSPAQRTTVKRTCIKSLPSVLCIHLMRFGFDWESGRSIKYDEQIRVQSSSKTKSSCIWIHKCYSNDTNTNVIFIRLLYCYWSSPGCWTWSRTPSLEWLVKTVAERAVMHELRVYLEGRPGRKSPSLRIMNWWELLSTVVRHMRDTIIPSLKTDGKRHWVSFIVWQNFIAF